MLVTTPDNIESRSRARRRAACCGSPRRCVAPGPRPRLARLAFWSILLFLLAPLPLQAEEGAQIIEAERLFGSATPGAQKPRGVLSYRRVGDPDRRVGVLLYALGFSEQINTTCRDQSGALLAPGTAVEIDNGAKATLDNLADAGALGFDLYVIDWCDKSDFIQRNAAVFADALERVQTGAVEGATPVSDAQRLVVIAHSMGGLIARYALSHQERHGPSHAVDLFVSFDSPQEGAYLPIGIQFISAWLRPGGEAANLIGQLPDEELRRLAGADTPAAQQMLLMHYRGPGGGRHPAFEALFAELDLLGYPQLPRTVAIASGNGSGRWSGSPLRDVVWHHTPVDRSRTFSLDYGRGRLSWEASLKVRLKIAIELTVKPYSSANQVQQVLRAAVRGDLRINGAKVGVGGIDVADLKSALDIPAWVPATRLLEPVAEDIEALVDGWLSPYLALQITESARGPAAFARAAAGTGGKFQQLVDSLQPFLGSPEQNVNSADPFIHTSSALGLDRDQWPVDAAIEARLAAGTLPTPFDRVYYHRRDTEHVAFTADVERWLCQEMRALTTLPSLEAISPDRRPVGATTFGLTATGKNFRNDLAIVWDNRALSERVLLPTTFVDSAKLVAEVPAELIDTLTPCSTGFCSPLFPVREPVAIYLHDPQAPEELSCRQERPFQIAEANIHFDREQPVTGAPFTAMFAADWRDGCVPRLPDPPLAGLPYTLQEREIRVTLEPTPGNCFFVLSPYEINFTFDDLAVGEYELIFEVDDGRQARDVAQTVFSVRYPQPAITALLPSAIAAGQNDDTPVVIAGAGIVDGVSTLYVNGVQRVATFVDEHTLTTTLAPADTAEPGALLFVIDNPDEFGPNASEPAEFTITDPPLTLTSVSPAAQAAGSDAIVVELNGAGFSQDSTATWTRADGTDQELPTEFRSAARLRATLSAAHLAAVGTFLLEVTDGNEITDPQRFSVRDTDVIVFDDFEG